MSAGGYCALNLGLRHRDAVATIIDMSGDTVPTHSHGAASLFGAHNPNGAGDVLTNSPARTAATLNPSRRPGSGWTAVAPTPTSSTRCHRSTGR
jgi:hypothetical protein